MSSGAEDHTDLATLPVTDNAVAPGLEKSAYHAVQIYYVGATAPVIVQVPKSATVGAITVAESSLTGMRHPIFANDPVGVAYKTLSTTEPFQQIHVREGNAVALSESDSHRLPPHLRCREATTRAAILFSQEGWVAHDEMCHYLHLIQCCGNVKVVPPCVLPDFTEDDELVNALTSWGKQCHSELLTHTRVISVLFVQNHWFPVMFRAGPFGVQVATTSEGRDWVSIMISLLPIQTDITRVRIFAEFANDCGFQAIAWLSKVSQFSEWPQDLTYVDSFTNTEACTWRLLFQHHLYHDGLANTLVAPAFLLFGGTGKFDVNDQLTRLLSERGVPASAVQHRADTILTQLGRSRVAQLLRGPQAWRDLKSAANALTPRLQLVQSNELSEVIQKRAAEPTPFGNKKTKTRNGHPKSIQAPVSVLPHDVCIPEGIFKDSDGNGLKQLVVADIGPCARGIVVVTAQEAVPYLRMSKPVSSQGLGLLVVDSPGIALNGTGQEIRFPAKCERTEEPMLLTGRLIQIGSKEVSRNLAEQAPRVEEVENGVIKVLLYRDECTIDWEEFCAQPVKHIIAQTPALQTKDCILDCRDRQFLSHKLAKTRPSAADLYSVSFRLTNVDFAPLLALSGRDGQYFEPRAVDGRSPSSEHRVVWLNKTSKPQALVALQSTTQWCCLVRAGLRFGLRVKTADAPAVHSLHRPSMTFLDSANLRSYIGGPFPYGATRATLSKLFTTWGWTARPLQPRGRSMDGCGTLWEIQSASPPPYMKSSSLANKMSCSQQFHRKSRKVLKVVPPCRAPSAPLMH